MFRPEPFWHQLFDRLSDKLLSRIRMQVVDVNQILGDTVDMLGRLIGEDIEIKLTLASGLRPIMADRVQLEQVLMNLVANARDAMPRGGRLTIETGSASEEEVSAALRSLVSSGRCVSLTIRDTGAGMDANTRSRIFEPFFTTKELGKGTGLGLATVYGIVKQLGGYISMSSEVGRGTTFTIYFPESQSTVEPEAPRTVGAASPPLAGGREVILLVEDETAVRNLVSLVLRRHGYTVLEARNGREGAALAAEQQGAIHVVLTDVVMPGIDGPETVKRLRESRPEMKVLYMTGYAGDALTRRGIVDASDSILHKPFTADELLKGVRELLDVDRGGEHA
jgi:two-component system cell cycle sensor histidine kinase/response regulator CckA